MVITAPDSYRDSMLKCATQDAKLLYEFQQQFHPDSYREKFSHLKNRDKPDFNTNLKAGVSNQSKASLPFIRKLMNPDSYREEGLMKIMEYVLIQFQKGNSLEQTFKSLTASLV